MALGGDKRTGYSYCLQMTREQLLAAEIFSYSFANYADHLGIGNIRFEKMMPDVARNLERADKEGWNDERLAKAIEIEVSEAPQWRERYREAVKVVDARNPAEAFRNAVRQSLVFCFKRHEIGAAEIEGAVTQVCYRTADLAYLLELRKEELSEYSGELRKEEGAESLGSDGRG